MRSIDETVIPLSKSKVLLLILGAAAFVAIGFLMLSMDSAAIEAERRFNNPLWVHGVGLASIIFFGLCGVMGVKRLFDRNAGLILNSAGIVNRVGGISVRLIPWSEIVGFNTVKVYRQQFLVVKVAHPEQYIEVGSAIQRRLSRANHNMYGSPILISSNTLKISFNDLLDRCHHYFLKYGKDI